MAKLLSLPGFLAIVDAVTRTETAMRSAAERPLDASRLEAARRAIAALPTAIVALADEFKRGNLHDEDYPQISAMLGGFVSPQSADIYRRFLRHPDRTKIPITGKGFPRKKTFAGQAPLTFRIEARPLYWRAAPLLRQAERLLLQTARAECATCDGGGDSDKGGDGGYQAAAILMGIAAIITAIAPMVIAGIQAAADVKIAKINAASQVKMTEITADTSKYLATKQEDIALTQANIAKDISQQNNQYQTKRLEDQLAELRNARQDARQAEQEKQAIEQQYNQERINLAVKQSNDNLRLARETLNSNLTQAGLTSGFNNSVNSGARLSVSTTTAAGKVFTTTGGGGGSGGQVIGASANPGAGGKPTSANDAMYAGIDKRYQDSLAKLDGGGTAQGFRGLTKPSADPKKEESGHASVSVRSTQPAEARLRLLAAATTAAGNAAKGEANLAPLPPSPLLLRGLALLQRRAVAKAAAHNGEALREVQRVMQKNLAARGSTVGHRLRSPFFFEVRSDLGNFIQRTKRPGLSFPDFPPPTPPLPSHGHGGANQAANR